MWNPFKKRSRANVHNLVVKSPETGLTEVHFVVTVDALADARDAIVECFEDVVSGHGLNPDFGGQVVFVVRGPVPGSDLPPALVAVQSQLGVRIGDSGLKTAKGQPLRVRVEYSESSL